MNDRSRLVHGAHGFRSSEPDGARRWLLTGVTGFIGREILVRILARDRDYVTVLVRPSDGACAESRVRELLESLYGERAGHLQSRVQVCAGDVSRPQLGLDPPKWQGLTRATHIVHMAARTRFDGALSEARRHNVAGVRRMLDLARAANERGILRSFVHVSTAYVAGAATHTVCAEDLDPNGSFRNVYEQSKAEAESLVRACFDELPCTVFRPSIVIGDSRTGEVANFNTIYWAIRTYLKGQRFMFANPDAPLDLVPVDYVADAMMHLIDQPASAGRTFLLAGGPETTVRLGDFAAAVTGFLRSPPAVMLSPRWFWMVHLVARLGLLPRRFRRLASNARSYLPYFSSNPRFDVVATQAALDAHGLRVPPISDYIDKIVGYCLARGFGDGSPMLARSRGNPSRSRSMRQTCSQQRLGTQR